MASPFFFIKKKDGSLRPVQDYRKLNDMTIKNRYPLPLISELVNKLKGAKYFTKLDVRWGYNNIQIKEGNEWKAAFLTNRGLFEPLVMFFGLMNSLATFQTMMNELFHDLINTGKVLIYLDDILIFTQNLNKHRKLVHQVLEILQQNKLYLKPKKCEFEKTKVEYLGMVISENSIKMDPIKVAGIKDWPVPKSKKELQSFLGFCNFYRQFIFNFSGTVKSLTKLTGNHKWEWGTDQQEAFETLKEKMMSAPCLVIPNDTGKFRLEADASNSAVGSVLSQEQDDKWYPVGFFSKSFSETERNYEIYDKEMLMIMLSLEEYQHWLMGSAQPFEVWTDHANLQYFRKPQKLNRRQACWVSELAEYNYMLHHRPGKQNTKADLLSRCPDHNMGFNENEDVVMLSSDHFRSLVMVTEVPEYIKGLKAMDRILDQEAKNGLRDKKSSWKEEDGYILKGNQIYVPKDQKLREKIISDHHDRLLAGHSGPFKTIELIT